MMNGLKLKRNRKDNVAVPFLNISPSGPEQRASFDGVLTGVEIFEKYGPALK